MLDSGEDVTSVERRRWNDIHPAAGETPVQVVAEAAETRHRDIR